MCSPSPRSCGSLPARSWSSCWPGSCRGPRPRSRWSRWSGRSWRWRRHSSRRSRSSTAGRRAHPAGQPCRRAPGRVAGGGRPRILPARDARRPPRRLGRRDGFGVSVAGAARRQPLCLDRADTARRRGHQRQPRLSGGGRRQLGPPRVRPGVGVRAHWPDQPDCGRARAGLGQPESGRGAAGAQPDPGRVCVSSGIAPGPLVDARIRGRHSIARGGLR